MSRLRLEFVARMRLECTAEQQVALLKLLGEAAPPMYCELFVGDDGDEDDDDWFRLRPENEDGSANPEG